MDITGLVVFLAIGALARCGTPSSERSDCIAAPACSGHLPLAATTPSQATPASNNAG